jgi:hypothetical protein
MQITTKFVKGYVKGYLGMEGGFHDNPYSYVGEVVEVPVTQCSICKNGNIVVETHDEFGSSGLVLEVIEFFEKEFNLPMTRLKGELKQ